MKPKKRKGISRRKFLVRSSIGLGIILGAGYLSKDLFRRYLAGYFNTAEPPYLGNTTDPSIWFEITEANEIILHSPKVEMGQGVFTGLAQIAADELEVDAPRLKVVHASSASGNVDGVSTGGSTSISSLWTPLRELAATMRQMLLLRAAQLLDAQPAELKLQDGKVLLGQQTLTYGQIVAQTTTWEVPEIPNLKPAEARKWVGRPIARLDLRDKVTGAAIFGMDAEMPDMLFGAVARPQHIGAVYQGVDNAAEVRKMPGVIAVYENSNFVGVVAKSRMEAENAKAALKVRWDIPRIWETEDIEALILAGKGTSYEIQRNGNPKYYFKNNEKQLIKAEFFSPIGAHAQIEPNGAVTHVTKDQAVVKISTQVVKITRQEVAKALGMDEEQVDIQPTYLGGGFGRRLHTPNAIQAALLSKAVGKPVRCFFDRREEFQNDTFRPPTHHVLQGQLSDDGQQILAIEHHVSSGDVMYGSPLIPRLAEPILGHDVGAWRGGMIQYGAIPHISAVSWRVKLPFATSWWRSLGLLANTFAIESFMDELAEKAEQDPVAFRLAHIQQDARGIRLRKVIEAAAELGRWQQGASEEGRALGFAASTDANTPVAQVAEVSLEGGKICVHRVSCAIDPGLAINPDQIRAQCEGAIIMGLSAAVYEAMYVEGGQLKPTIYGPYRMALMKDAPKEIDVRILENADSPGAVGEPPLGPIGAAIANALYRLTGKRMRRMPLAEEFNRLYIK